MSVEDTRRTALAVLAGETVLGTLDVETVEAGLRDDPVFREESIAWERRLVPLLGLPAEIAPSSRLWPRILNESGLETRGGAVNAASAGEVSSPDIVVPLASARPERTEGGSSDPIRFQAARAEPTRIEPDVAGFGPPAPVIDFEQAVTARTQAIQRRLSVWRRTALGSGALAAGLAVVVGLGTLELNRASSGRFIGVVDATGGVPPLVVSLDTGSGELMVRPVGMQAEPGKSHELWALPPGGQPVSLGVVDTGGHRPTGAMPMGTWRDPNLVLAVSVEPQGGSPTGQPTGPVVYKGKLIPAE